MISAHSGGTDGAATVINNRAHPRLKADLKARLLSLDGRCNYNCMVVDVSEGGARVASAHVALIPSRVFLAVADDILECDVRWRRDGQLGLQFIDDVSRLKRAAL